MKKIKISLDEYFAMGGVLEKLEPAQVFPIHRMGDTPKSVISLVHAGSNPNNVPMYEIISDDKTIQHFPADRILVEIDFELPEKFKN